MARLIKVSPYLGKDWQECMEDFLLEREANGLAKRTLADYRYYIRLFFTRYKASLHDYEALRRAVLEFFAESARHAPDTFNTRRKFLKAFFAWAVREGILPANPIDGIKAKKQRERVVEIDTEALQKLLEAPDLTTYVGLRDYALLCLTLDTGIRPSEALGLLPQDINLRSREVLVREEVAKTRITRTLPILPHTAEAIRRLLAVRPPEWGNAPVFCTYAGTKMNVHAWQQRVKKYREKLGLNIRPYDLRHAYATLYLRAGGQQVDLQRIMGWTSPRMVQRYAKLIHEDLKERHAQSSPLAELVPKRRRMRKIRPGK